MAEIDYISTEWAASKPWSGGLYEACGRQGRKMCSGRGWAWLWCPSMFSSLIVDVSTSAALSVPCLGSRDCLCRDTISCKYNTNPRVLFWSEFVVCKLWVLHSA